MGIIRALLALLICFMHANVPTSFKSGYYAVQAFHLISGFSISNILLSGKYDTRKDFYYSRFLRYFPPYFCVLLLAVALRRDIFTEILKLPWIAQGILAFSNLTLFGIDSIMFMSVQGDTVSLTSNFKESDPILVSLLYIPQAWSLGVEIWFYLVVPFIYNRKSLLIGGFLLSLGIRVFGISQGWGAKDPFTYRFFPFELSLFILGMFSHQFLYMKYDFFKNMRVSYVSLFICFTYILTFNYKLATPLSALLLFAILFLTLPGLFTFSKQLKYDRFIAEISYPIFLVHFLVIHQFQVYFGKTDKRLRDWSILIVTLILSYLLKTYCSDQVEKIRKRFKQRKLSQSP